MHSLIAALRLLLKFDHAHHLAEHRLAIARRDRGRIEQCRLSIVKTSNPVIEVPLAMTLTPLLQERQLSLSFVAALT